MIASIPVEQTNVPARASSARGSWWLALVAVWVAASFYTYAGLHRGWVPHDAGQLLQAAMRVNAGEVPHRDFDEMYTGGLTHLNSVALRAFGERLTSLRLVLLFVFILWVPAVFYLASHFGSPLMAAAVTTLAVAWSLPNYPAPLPSWYNLFLAVFGVAGVVRFIDTGRVRWLFAAGVCGGLSLLIKVTGLYYIAGVLLFLLYREQSETWRIAEKEPERARLYSALISIGLLTFVFAVASTIRAAPNLEGVLIFVVPSATVALVLLFREGRFPPGPAVARVLALANMVVPFLGGFAVPVALYLSLYVFKGGWTNLIRDVFVAPQLRLQFASYPLPSFSFVLCGPILLLTLIALHRKSAALDFAFSVAVANVLVAVLRASASSAGIYQLAWRPVMFLLPAVTLAGAFPAGRVRVASPHHQKASLLLFVTATCSLVQFPFPAGIYFCYVAPLLAVSLAALSTARRRTPHPLAAILLVFYVLFAVFRITPGFIYAMGRHYEPDSLSATLTMPQARGLRVFPSEARTYNRVIELVGLHSGARAIYAFPDAPEIYALSGKPNPTRTIYEFLADPPITDEAVLDRLARHDVGLVVVKMVPHFSGRPSEWLLARIRERFPMGETLAEFEVRWR